MCVVIIFFIFTFSFSLMSNHLVFHYFQHAVSFLIFQGAVIPVWEQKCVQAFHSSNPGMELDACLWSLADVVKKVVRGAQQGKRLVLWC